MHHNSTHTLTVIFSSNGLSMVKFLSSIEEFAGTGNTEIQIVIYHCS